MNFFQKFKTYIHANEQSVMKKIHGGKNNSGEVEVQLKKEERKADSYQLIMLDILDGTELSILRKSADEDKSNDYFEDLVFEEEDHEELENMYMKDFIFVNKLEEGRELTVEEWKELINSGSLSVTAKKNIYFSVLKGIKFQVRKGVWELFANTAQMKKLTNRTYQELASAEFVTEKNIIQIDKDVPRSKATTKYLKELRNVLIAYCAFSGKEYTQGMNLIAGSLLTLLSLENDEELGDFEIVENQFEERVFWIFIGVMVEKKWQNIFDHNLEGLTTRLRVLESLMIEHVPSIYQKLFDFQWDLTIFSQYYITIMLYNSPKQFSKIILDLFLIDGENALHSLIIRMMKLQEETILGFIDEGQLMNYFKKDMIMDCYLRVKKNQFEAKKLEDFDINFMKVNKS